MSAGERFRNFKPSGPVAAAFLADTASRVKLLRGPVGGGKTVTNVFDGLVAAAQRMPICRDGKIHCKDTIIGSTYGQLERNLYPTWNHWLPRDGGLWTEGEWEGGGGRFAQHSLSFDTLREGRRVEVCYTAVFAAIGELSVEQFVRGFEPSIWYLFECDQLPEGIIEQAVGRLGRWPNKDMLPAGAEWRGYVRGDLNAPDSQSWYYGLVEEVRPPGLKQYVQPGGLSPKAENLHNLPRAYYQNLAALNAHKSRWIKRFIHNEYGPAGDGLPVYPEYSDEVHLARDELSFRPGRPILLGFDQGLQRPAMLIGQRGASGQMRVLAEMVPGRMNARRFAQLCRALLAEVCPNAEIQGAWADPAGFTGADREAGEMAWAEIVSSELGVQILPAPSNELDLRLTAVKDELTFMVEPGMAALVISSHRCPLLRKGFNSDYCYAKQRIGSSESFADKPDKRRESADPHDALQYLLLGEKGRYGVIAGRTGKAGAHWPTGGSVTMKSDFMRR